jgi:hypothetical protein
LLLKQKLHLRSKLSRALLINRTNEGPGIKSPKKKIKVIFVPDDFDYHLKKVIKIKQNIMDEVALALPNTLL